jgi:hypothetical protein
MTIVFGNKMGSEFWFSPVAIKISGALLSHYEATPCDEPDLDDDWYQRVLPMFR